MNKPFQQRRRTFRLRKLTPAIIAEQQKVADFYF